MVALIQSGDIQGRVDSQNKARIVSHLAVRGTDLLADSESEEARP